MAEKNEKYSLFVSEEKTANIRIADLPVENYFKISCRMRNIYTLQQLLNKSDKEILGLRNIGIERFRTILLYINSLGYKFLDQRIKEMENWYKTQGIKCITELELSSESLLTFLKADIQTVEELLDYDSDVLRLLKPAEQEKLKRMMKEFNWEFKNNSRVKQSFDSDPDFEALQTEIKAAQQRIAQKKELLQKYQALAAQRKELLSQEENLDDQIAEIEAEGQNPRDENIGFKKNK